MSKKLTPSKTKSPSSSKEKKETVSPSKSPSIKQSAELKQGLNWIISNFEGFALKNQVDLSPTYLYSSYGGARCQLSIVAFQLLGIKIGDLVQVYFQVPNKTNQTNEGEIRSAICTAWPLNDSDQSPTSGEIIPSTAVIIDPLVSFPISKKEQTNISKKLLSFFSFSSFSQILDFQKLESSLLSDSPQINTSETIASEKGNDNSEIERGNIEMDKFWMKYSLVEKISTFPSKASKIEFNIHVKNLSSSSSSLFSQKANKTILSSDLQKQIEIKSTDPPATYVQIGATTSLKYHLLQRNSQVSEKPISSDIPTIDPADLKPDVDHVISNEVGGLDAAMNSLREIVVLPLLYSVEIDYLHIDVPRGPPGVGKTLMVRTIAKECNTKLYIINGPEIISPVVGQTEEKLRNIFEEASIASTASPTILFIDEIDALCPRRSDQQTAESRVVTQLLTLMDGMTSTVPNKKRKTIVIAATNRPNSLDPALRRPGRFDREIEVSVPNTTERLQILKVHTKSLPLDASVDLETIARQLPGYVGADIASLCRESAMHAIRSQSRKSDENVFLPKQIPKITMADFEYALSVVTPSTQRETHVDFAKVSWDEIAGLDSIKLKLKQSVEWPLSLSHVFSNFGLSPPRGILLHGPSGCGKTLLVKALVSTLKVSFMTLSGSSVFSPYVGDAEQLIRDTFRKARLGSPSIIFIDEMEALVGKRSNESTSGGVQERVLATLLNEMDGIEVLKEVMIVAATTRIDLIDKAILRPGRMDVIIHVPFPDFFTRLKILELFTKKMPLDSDVDLNEISAKMENGSGSDVEKVCREAALAALRENLKTSCVSMKHFIAALSSFRPKSVQQKKSIFI